MYIYRLVPRIELLYMKDSPFSQGKVRHAGFVVRAKSEKEARNMASQLDCDDEDNLAWLDKTLVLCDRIKLKGKSEMILADWRCEKWV